MIDTTFIFYLFLLISGVTILVIVLPDLVSLLKQKMLSKSFDKLAESIDEEDLELEEIE